MRKQTNLFLDLAFPSFSKRNEYTRKYYIYIEREIKLSFRVLRVSCKPSFLTLHFTFNVMVSYYSQTSE